MNDCRISSQHDICIWIGDVTFTNLLGSCRTAYWLNMKLKFSLHDQLILVFTLKLNWRLQYRFSTTYSYLDRWSNIYQVVSIYKRELIYKIYYQNSVCIIHWYQYSHWNYMNNCRFNSERYSHIEMWEVTFPESWVSLLRNIFIQYDNELSMQYPVLLVFLFEFNEWL
jgi:hypothetical protein